MKEIQTTRLGRTQMLARVFTCLIVIPAIHFVYTSKLAITNSFSSALNFGDPVNINNTTPTETAELPAAPRVFCMVFTTINKWETRGRAVYSTWVKRCTVFRMFYSALPNKTLPIPEGVALNVKEGRGHLLGKTLAALRVAYNMMGDKVDWYLKADDDTYVIYENLLYALSGYNSSEPRYVGKRILTNLPNGFNSGGASYALSHATADILVNKGKKRCAQYGSLEDVGIGVCLKKFGVYPEDALDLEGRQTFHSDNPYYVLDASLLVFYPRKRSLLHFYQIKRWGQVFGKNSAHQVMFSPVTVSLHYFLVEHIYFVEFLLYDLQRLNSKDAIRASRLNSKTVSRFG